MRCRWFNGSIDVGRGRLPSNALKGRPATPDRRQTRRAPKHQGEAHPHCRVNWVSISRSVDARSQPERARAPYPKNKNKAPQAKFCGDNPSKQAGSRAFWPPEYQYNHPQQPVRPIRPTRSVDHPTDPSTPRGPSLAPPLGPIGTRPNGTQCPGPPSGPPFSVFLFSRLARSLWACHSPSREIKNAPPGVRGSGGLGGPGPLRLRASVHLTRD